MPCEDRSFGPVQIIACGRHERHACSMPGCTSPGRHQCDYAVTRAGKAGTCDRWLCDRCRVSRGENVDYCGPHARAAGGSR